jgi:hypothetical protein
MGIVTDKEKKYLLKEEQATKPGNADRWFDAQLTRLYTDIANEPLPDELELLVQKLINQVNDKKDD